MGESVTTEPTPRRPVRPHGAPRPFTGPFNPLNEHHHALLLENNLPKNVGLAFVEPRTGYGLVDGWAKNAARSSGCKKWHLWVLCPDGTLNQVCNRVTAEPAKFVANPLGRRCERCDRFRNGESPFYVVQGNPLWPTGVRP